MSNTVDILSFYNLSTRRLYRVYSQLLKVKYAFNLEPHNTDHLRVSGEETFVSLKPE